MAKPTINKIVPFDANYDKSIYMTWFGNMPYKNRIIIYNAESMNVIFDDTIISYQTEHVIPAYTLQNGNKYVIQGQFFDSEGIESVLSDKIYFFTFETPAFYFRGLTSGDVIKSASYHADIIYQQADWEDISSYQFSIYDYTKALLTESNLLYDTDDITYSFKGLENGKIYYIRCVGSTVNGLPLDTGYIQLIINYENPNIYARIYTENDKRTGINSYTTNLKIIESSANEEFDYNNGLIDLIDKTLIYNEGFLIPGDFTITIRGIGLYRTNTILTGKNDHYGFTLSSHIYDEGKLRFKLSVPNGVCNYTLYSEDMVFSNEDMITIHIRRINNIYLLKCFIEYGYSEQTDMWFGTNTPAISQMSQYDIWIDVGNSLAAKVNKDDVQIYASDEEPDIEQKYAIWIGGE